MSISSKITTLTFSDETSSFNGSGVTGIPQPVDTHGHVGHWEKCESDKDCELYDDVCCESKKTYKSKDIIKLCGTAERMTVSSGVYAGWKYKCPIDKIQKGAEWLSVGTAVIGISLY